jgi:hypothetical protein
MSSTETNETNLINHALGAMTTAANGSGTAPTPVGNAGNVDMASVLAKIQALEREKSQLSASLVTRDARLAKLQEGKKAEMETLMNSTISKWLAGLDTKDVDAKDQLKSGLESLIEQGDESGVWNVIACASNSWVANVNSIENLTNEVNAFKEKEKELQGGMFLSEVCTVSHSLLYSIPYCSEESVTN